jgi:hypothetical protein
VKTNFLSIETFPNLVQIKDELVQAACKDYYDFLQNLPIEQHTKYNKILQTDYIKMYSLPFMYSSVKKCGCTGYKEELFNFILDGPEQNYALKTAEMQQIAGKMHVYSDAAFFANTLKILPTWLSVAWIFCFKQGALVLEDEGHGHDAVMIHFLLEDIEDGDFIVSVDREEKLLSKKGDYFIFNGILPHRASLTGQNARFVSFAMNPKDLL